MINREDKRLSNSVVDILNMLEMGESVDMIASDMNSKTTNIRRIIRENDIGQDTISTTLQWRKAIKKLLPDREANVIRWNESKESAIPFDILPTAKAGGFLHQPPLRSNRSCCVLHDVRQALLPVCPTVRYVLV